MGLFARKVVFPPRPFTDPLPPLPPDSAKASAGRQTKRERTKTTNFIPRLRFMLYLLDA